MSLEHNDKITWVEIKKLKPHPRNPNKHSKEQIERLAEIIKYQGFRSPVVVSNRSGFIVAGHGRVEAAVLNELKKVPVSYQDFADDEQEYAHMVADNAIADWANLDLSAVNKDILELGPDFEIEHLGIKNFHLDISEKVNKGDENSEWVGMPEFEAGEGYIKVILHFKTEKDREEYCDLNRIVPTKKLSNQWIVHIS